MRRTFLPYPARASASAVAAMVDVSGVITYFPIPKLFLLGAA